MYAFMHVKKYPCHSRDFLASHNECVYILTLTCTCIYTYRQTDRQTIVNTWEFCACICAPIIREFWACV